ncbi:MAG: SusC/RagA family TonB-linked outer membrane protein [Bacteroidetes bacterium]|nr:SusC/RagA family TonB-linked outer membrane protein [Bacteroidota bacterium]
MKKFKCLLTALGSFAIMTVFAQTREVTGRVTDASGNAVPGASIKIRGVKAGASASADGIFKINVPANAVLTVSGIGFETQELSIGNLTTVSIILKQATSTLNEVVVTALGIKREKRSLAYAVQTISNDEINKSGKGNAVAELDGKVSGLTVINSSGDPGSGTYFNLRGITSLTGNNQPLIVVDGIPIDNSINAFDPTGQGFAASGANGNLTGGAQSTNRGVDLNPNDIESITALKGPAATALYGIQAASGAIIITTKKGAGIGKKLNISFNSSYTNDQENKLPGHQEVYAQGSGGVYYGPASSASGKRLSWGPAISTLSRDGIATPYDPNGSIVSNSSPNAKFAAKAYNPYTFFQHGLTFNNNIALSSGTDKNGFRMSLGNLYQTGIIPKSKFDKTTFNISGQAELTKRLNVTGAINFIMSDNDKVQQGSNISGVMLGLLRTPPTFDNSNGLSDPVNNPASYVLPSGQQRDYRGSTSYDNPYWTVNRNPFTSNLNRAIGYGNMMYKLLDWMDVNYRLGGDVYTQSDKSAYDIYSGAFPAGAIYEIEYRNQQFNSNLSVNLHKEFSNDLTGSLILGQDYFTLYSNTRFTQGTGLVFPNFLDMSNATSYQSSEGTSKTRRMAYYGQAELNFRQMIYLTLTGRRETSSTLPVQNHSFFYPSASLGWVFTELEGLKGNNILSFGKLRLSYAQVGKDAPAQALQTYFKSASIVDGFTSGISFPFNSIPGYQLSSATAVIGNPDLKPETDRSYEAGLDLSFVKNRINLSATYYYQKSIDQILTVPIAYTTGFAAILRNAGTLRNSGVEISLNTTPLKLSNGLRWDVNVNWSMNKNKVLQLAPGVNTLFIAGFTNGGVYAVAGQPYGEIYGTDYIRTTATKGSPSQLVIDDIAGDAGYGMPIVGTTSVPLANFTPKWIGSVLTTLSFKAFSIAAQLDVRHGGQMWNGTKGAMQYFGTSTSTLNRGQSTVFNGVLGHPDGSGNIVHYVGANEVAGAGDPNTIQSSYSQYYWQNIGSSFVGPTSVSIEDGSFVRLKQISLSYDVPKKALGKYLHGLSLTIFANNPKLWTKYSGVDPETSLAGPANGQGIDYFNNPGTKSWGVRLNVGL